MMLTPQELLARIDTKVLYPPFLALVEKLLANCSARGAQYYCICGTRTVQEQNDLYAQGRTKPGPIVTKAKGGESYHNFNVAADFAPDKDQDRAGLQPDYNKPAYQILAEEAQKLGLEPGYFWKFTDAPHVQLKISAHGLDLHNLLDAYNKNGPIGVTKLLDGYSWPKP